MKHMTDKDGNTYKTVQIGKQEWVAENLNVCHFRNGDRIPGAKSKRKWRKANNKKQPAWCYYDNDPANGEKYGKLYNWFAVKDTRGLAPVGWHLPTDDEWLDLTIYLGGKDEAGDKLKETGTTHWLSPNKGASNKTGFTSLPGGARHYLGEFFAIGHIGYWWSATENNADTAWFRVMASDNSGVLSNTIGKELGFSVRCVRIKSL